MTILITGVTGFIGMNLGIKLLKLGHRIIGIDNFYTSPESRLEVLNASENFEFIKHDIIEPLPKIRGEKIDAICNLACPASPIQYLRDPLYTTKVSIYGIVNVLECAREHEATILQASTSEIYGDPLEHPQKEEYWGHVNPNGPRACYDEGKRVAESICFDYHRKFHTKIKVIRIFNTYGPYMAENDGRVVSNFISQAMKGRPLTVYGKGTQTRSFCFVDDLVDGIVKFLLLKDQSITGPINLGNPQELTIMELVKEVQKFFSDLKIEFHSLPENDPQQRKPDITKAKTLLEWSPRIDLSEGISRSIDWFKSEC